MPKKDLIKYEEKSIWKKIKENLKKFFGIKENKEVSKETMQIEERIDLSEYEEESNEIIRKAKKAFEIYALNKDIEITEKIVKTLKERLEENEGAIERLIHISKEKIEYNDIVDMLEEENKDIDEYKKTEYMEKIDEKFIYSKYQVPVGIILIETDDVKEAIRNIFKGIITRNAIIIKQTKENIYRIERLILMIMQECIKKYGIDENIVQIIEEEEVPVEKVNVYINKEENKKGKERSKIYYIYEEDEYFKNIINEEIEKLKKVGKIVQVLTGNIDSVIDKINETKNIASSIYTKDRQIGYKYINMVQSDNVYMNTTLEKAKENNPKENIYYMSKNIICEYK